MKIPKKKTTTAKAKIWTQAELDALTRKRGYNFRLELARIHKQAIAMEAYLEKHPGQDPMRWSPEYNRDPREWTYIQDRCGRMFVSAQTPKQIGDTYEFGSCLVPWNDAGGKRQTVVTFATVLRQVSMAEVITMYGRGLNHKPYCYEVICD